MYMFVLACLLGCSVEIIGFLPCFHCKQVHFSFLYIKGIKNGCDMLNHLLTVK